MGLGNTTKCFGKKENIEVGKRTSRRKPKREEF
jgi:hypothetical protein